ncbi:MAG TPA: L-threonylcarbamoyladenylate synthase [Verrucomicrobiae bacterium]|nr:L-threonylcarbamoyladenylate synthase [Verrucomicrobiae bacterium]
MKTEILPAHTPELFHNAVRRAAELLRAGEVVALPTETVYGLAANALDENAVARIFQIKGRPANNPIIVHVAGNEMAKRCVKAWPELAERLSRAFWPGPLTLVLARSQKSEVRNQKPEISGSSGLRPPTSGLWIPDAVTAGGPTVGIRWPSHPFMQAVIRECGFPLAAPSANLSERVSPTNAGHVHRQLAGRIPLIVDGGQSQVGIESTVLDLTVAPPRILRPGMIHEESLAAAGLPVANCQLPIENGALKSPGQLKKHYSPRARLIVAAWQNEAGLLEQIGNWQLKIGNIHVIAHTHIPSPEDFANVSVIPHDAEAFARALYAELHRCDEAGAAAIVVEAPPDLPEWAAIGDRLRRAAA